MLLNVDWEQRVDFERMRKYRIGRIVEQLKKRNMRAVMLSKIDTVRYATSFRGVYTWQFHGNRYIALITDEGHISFFVGSGEFARVKESMPWLTDVTAFPFVMEEGYDVVEAKLKELGITKGKVGIDMMKYAMVDKLQKGFPDIEFTDGYCVVEGAQLVKNDDEIMLMQEAAKLADIGMTTMLDTLAVGKTELECSAAAVKKMMELGSEDVAYYPLCESGIHGANTYKYPTLKRIQNGDMIWMDNGTPFFGGYAADIARTAVVGKATDLQKRVYSGIYDMLWYATEELKPGAKLDAPLKAAQEAAAKHGLSKYVYYGILGHGVGTDLHIAPTIGDSSVKGDIKREVDTFTDHMVISLEPGIFITNVCGGAVENMILITEHGPEPMTHTRFEEHLLVNTGK